MAEVKEEEKVPVNLDYFKKRVGKRFSLQAVRFKEDTSLDPPVTSDMDGLIHGYLGEHELLRRKPKVRLNIYGLGYLLDAEFADERYFPSGEKVGQNSLNRTIEYSFDLKRTPEVSGKHLILRGILSSTNYELEKTYMRYVILTLDLLPERKLHAKVPTKG